MLSGGAIHYITVVIDNGRTKASLPIEEFHPCEPSAYQWEAGWTCYDGDVEYFISQGTGTVWQQPENIEVGIAPHVAAASDRMEAQISAALEGAFHDEERYGR